MEGFAGDGTFSDGDQEALYDRQIPHMGYFDAQAGVRADLDSGPTRVWAAVGVEGLAPYFFAFEPTFYVRAGGHIAGRISGSWDLFITQRWVVQPQAELTVSRLVRDTRSQRTTKLSEANTKAALLECSFCDGICPLLLCPESTNATRQS